MNAVANGINSQVADAPATDGTGQGMTDAERLELLGKLPPAELELMASLTEMLAEGEPIEDVKAWAALETRRLERAQSRQEAATASPATEQAETPTEAKTDPFDGERLMFAEPETYLQPVGHLARYVLAHLLMGEFGNRLFGDDYLDADNFEKVHGLYIDVRDGIAHGFPGIEYDEMLPTIIACENKFYM